jgi:hypothetical protein
MYDLQNFISPNKLSHLYAKLHTLVQNFISPNKLSHLYAKLHTLVQNFISGYTILYLGTKLHTYLGMSRRENLKSFRLYEIFSVYFHNTL